MSARAGRIAYTKSWNTGPFVEKVSDAVNLTPAKNWGV